MTEFIESPIYNNWLKLHQPQESIICVSPYIKREAVDRIIPEGVSAKILIRGNIEEFIYQSSSDIEALYPFYYSEQYDKHHFRRLQNLHMKAYLVDGKELLVTSGNFTRSGMFLTAHRGNAEGGIATNDSKIIRQFLDYLDRLWQEAQPLNEFFPELSKAYAEYLQKKQDGERLKQEQKKYVYHARIAAEQWMDSAQPQFTMQDIPPKGYIEGISSGHDDQNNKDILLALQILNDRGRSITYRELGEILRNQYKVRSVELQDNQKENQANDKVGQEYSRLAAYFALVDIEKRTHLHRITLTDLGRQYLNGDAAMRRTILYDQLCHREAFLFFESMIPKESIEAMTHGDRGAEQDFRVFLSRVVQAEKTSIQRSIPICRDLLIFLHEQRKKEWY